MVDGQNMLLIFKDIDEKLTNDILPTTVSDKISVFVKRNELIKQFGSRYITSHKEKHFINVVSQKMRLLSRFFMSIQLEISSINSL